MNLKLWHTLLIVVLAQVSFNSITWYNCKDRIGFKITSKFS